MRKEKLRKINSNRVQNSLESKTANRIREEDGSSTFMKDILGIRHNAKHFQYIISSLVHFTVEAQRN